MANEDRLTIHKSRVPCYDIVYARDFDALVSELRTLEIGPRKVCIITDTNVGPLYGKTVLGKVKEVCKNAEILTIPAGEENKNLDVIRDIFRHLIEEGYDRSSLLIALGGGVVGDMTGFAAATYLRGIDYIQIPTTLLSQADSSIGGKTGVDFDGYKNMIGAFKMPILVYENVSVLKTLDDRQYASGFAEVMKHGLILDGEYYEWLIDHMEEIQNRRPSTLQKMLLRSNKIKQEVVENDPYEKGNRMLLNFGHTLGHAIEKESGFTRTHGECVALGCTAAAYISYKRGYIDADECYEVRDMFVPFGLPITLPKLNIRSVISLTKKDKKAKEGNPRFILLRGIGEAFVANDVTQEEMKEALEQLVWKDEA